MTIGLPPAAESSFDHAHRAIAESPVVGLVRSRGGRVVWSNSALAEMFGYDPSEMVGLSTTVFYPDLAAFERMRARVMAVTTAGGLFKDQVQFRRRDGSMGWYQVSWAQLGDDSGELLGAFVDVTERVDALTRVIESESRLRSVFMAMSEGLVVYAADGAIIDANPAAEAILGVSREQLLDLATLDEGRVLLHEDGTELPHADRPVRVTLRTGEARRGTIIGVRTGRAPPRWLRVNTEPMLAGDPPRMIGVIGTFVDVTAERDAAAALRHARDELQSALLRLRRITDEIPMSIALYDADDRIAFANREYSLIGRSGVKAEGARAIDFMREDTYRDSTAARHRALAGERVRLVLPARLPDGVRTREVTYAPYRDLEGRIVGVLALGYDITELEQSQARLREVAEQLATVRETERREIAIALHEGPAQDLYAARLGVERLRAGRHDAETVAALEDIHGIVEQAVREIGSLTNDLYPTSLQHLTLPVVLEQHVAKFTERSGIRVALHVPTTCPPLDADRKLLLFRAAQEALTNIWRHAGATRADLTLGCVDGQIRLVVEDDGRGFAASGSAKPGSLGLLAMRERFAAAGGGLRLGAAASGGASLTAWIPATDAAQAGR